MIHPIGAFAQQHKLPDNVRFVGDFRQRVRDHVIDSVFHLDKKYDFQFRLWELGMMVAPQVFIMTLKDGKWEARAFQLTGKGSKKYTRERNPYYTEKEVRQNGLDTLWKKLVKNDILKLTSEKRLESQQTDFAFDTSLLEDRGVVYQKLGTVQVDGTLYVFELFAPGKTRIYHYGSPIVQANWYPYIEVYYKVTGMILLIKKQMGQSYHQTLKEGGFYREKRKPKIIPLWRKEYRNL